MASGALIDEFPGTKWLYGMYVAPKARDSRVAASLVDAVGQWARAEGTNALYLVVKLAVSCARAFYGKVGFEWTGEIIVDLDPDRSMLTMVHHFD